MHTFVGAFLDSFFFSVSELFLNWDSFVNSLLFWKGVQSPSGSAKLANCLENVVFKHNCLVLTSFSFLCHGPKLTIIIFASEHPTLSTLLSTLLLLYLLSSNSKKKVFQLLPLCLFEKKCWVALVSTNCLSDVQRLAQT